MERQFFEADWKTFSVLRTLALDRFCQRILTEVGQLAAAADKNHHERYLAVFKLIRERDEEIADAFKDSRRSTFLVQLARIQYLELLTEEEFARFSPDTRESVEMFLKMWRE